MKTANEIRIDFYGTGDSRAYDNDELSLMEEYAELKVKEALESKPVAVAFPSDEEINKLIRFKLCERGFSNEKWLNNRGLIGAVIEDTISQATAIDIEDFLKWYKPNHKLYFYDEPSNIIAKYNEYKQKQG